MGLRALDNPLVLSTLFYPRPATPGRSEHPDAHDGTIPVADEVALGYRLYVHTPDAPVILYFHGNGEVAADYDLFAPMYHVAGASLLVVDYRGYGWSGGRPTVSALLGDVAPVVDGLPAVLHQHGVTNEALIVKGRSLGSACAIQAAHQAPERFKGLILESGFARATRLLARLGLPSRLTDALPDPVGNDRKLGEIDLPLLVIHGENDTLIPVDNGQALYDASPAAHKRLLRIPRVGHNDLLFVALDAYFDAVGAFIRAVTTSSPGKDV